MMSVQLRSRDKIAIGAALGILSLAAWLATLYQAQEMNTGGAEMQMSIEGTDMQMSLGGADGQMSSGMQPVFSLLPSVLFLSTWVVMMTAMMLPSTAPMVMTYAALSQQRRSRYLTYQAVGLFVVGYLLVWSGLGLLAYLVWTLSPLIGMAFPELGSRTGLVGGGVLILAGAYQLSSLKNICLAHCRTPMGFILTHWREGKGGALRMGLQHGLYCLGCCWALMAILFVVGIMNLAAMGLLAVFVFVEKVSARGPAVGKIAGVLLVIAGAGMAFHSIL